jgi:hypothetical protein
MSSISVPAARIEVGDFIGGLRVERIRTTDRGVTLVRAGSRTNDFFHHSAQVDVERPAPVCITRRRRLWIRLRLPVVRLRPSFR